MTYLDDLPTDECRGRLCVDYVLNGPVLGGLASLANGTGPNRPRWPPSGSRPA